MRASCSDSWTMPRFSCSNSKREFSQSPREAEPLNLHEKFAFYSQAQDSLPRRLGVFSLSTHANQWLDSTEMFWIFCAVQENFPQGLFLQDAVEGGIALITKSIESQTQGTIMIVFVHFTRFLCVCAFFSGEFGTCGIVSRIGPKVNSLLWIYSWRAVADMTGMEMLTQLLVALVCTTHSSALDVTMLWEVIHWLYTGYTVVSEEVT